MNKKLYAKLLSAIICGSIILPTANYSYAQESSSNVIENIAKDTFTLTEEDYKTKNASELAELVRTNKIKSEDLVKISYSIIKKENPELNAVISTREEEALEEARKLDLLTGEERNKPFFGVPTLMKGFGHNVKGQPSTYGYTYNKDAVAKNDSRITNEFKNLGFVILGTTNYPEGAMRNITDSILYGPAKNPLNPDYNTGGSSGGSAGAVASGMVPIASGSDIGGSIRIPSAWTGLIGLKPTSESGYAVHFPIVKSANDAEIFFDNTVKLKKELVNVDDIKSLKIGYSLKAPKGVTISDEVIKATLESVEFLRSQGFTVEEIDYPLDGNEMLAKYTHVATSGSRILDKTLAKKGLTKYDVDPLTWALHIYSKDLNSKDSKKLKTDAIKFLEKQTEIISEFHKKYPIILTPTTATKAPLNTDYYVTDEMKDILYNFDKVAKEERYNILVKQWEPMFNRTPFTLISNLTKEPTITLPTYIGENNLPIGVMLNAPLYHDKVLLKFAKFFEEHGMFKMNKAITKIITKKGTGLTTEKPEVHFGNGKGVVIEKPEEENNINVEPKEIIHNVVETLGDSKVEVSIEDESNKEYKVEVKDVTESHKQEVLSKIEGKVDSIKIIDIDLLDANTGDVVKTNKDRTVRITLVEDLENKSVSVYYVDNNGELTLVPSTVENDTIVFSVNHFIKYAITVSNIEKYLNISKQDTPEGKFIGGLNIEDNNKDKDSTIVLESSNKVVIENKNDTKEKNTVKKLPATGIENNSNLLWLLLSNILLIAMIFVRRNYKE